MRYTLPTAVLVTLFSTLVSTSPLLLDAGSQKLFGTYFGSPGRVATFDYVIVGGGTAGSVVASRLAQNTNASIAIIEAGSFYEISSGNLSQIPYYSESYDSAASGLNQGYRIL